MYYARKQATQAQIDAYRDQVREEFKGQGFDIRSNGYGLRIECNNCHASATLNPEMWARNHNGNCPATTTKVARIADFRETVINADGTKSTILYYA